MGLTPALKTGVHAACSSSPTQQLFQQQSCPQVKPAKLQHFQYAAPLCTAGGNQQNLSQWFKPRPTAPPGRKRARSPSPPGLSGSETPPRPSVDEMIAEHDAQAAQRARQAALHAAASTRAPAKSGGQQESLQAHADHKDGADTQPAQGAEGGIWAPNLGSKSSDLGSRPTALASAGSIRGPREAGTEAAAQDGAGAGPGRSGL